MVCPIKVRPELKANNNAYNVNECDSGPGAAIAFSFFNSGDKLHSSIFKKIKNQANDINLIEFFGTSETSFISYNLNQQAPVESVGVLFPNVELKTTNHDHNGIGTICIKSNMMFSGYVSEQ